MNTPEPAFPTPETLGLPHREPFLFVDAILALEAEHSVRGEKTFSGNEAFFAGHFPNDPLVPGVILTEALAQIAGLAGGGNGRRFLLSAIRSMKFPGPVRPGEGIILEAKKSGQMGGLWMFEVCATVEDRIVAQGQIVLNEVAS